MGAGALGPVQDVGKVHAVILEPGRVEDAVAVDRRQVLAPFAVDVQLDRHGPAAAALDHAQRDGLLWRARRAGAGCRTPASSTAETGMTWLPDGPDRWKQASGWAVYSIRISVGGQLGELVVVGVGPGVVGVEQARRGGDHLAQVELDLLEQPVLVQVGPEGLARGQRQPGLAARLPAQGERGDVAGGDGRQDDHAGHRLEAQAGDGLVGVGVLPGPQPVDPRARIGGVDARLGPAPVGPELLVRRRGPGGACGGRPPRSSFRPSSRSKGAHLVAAADGDPRLGCRRRSGSRSRRRARPAGPCPRIGEMMPPGPGVRGRMSEVCRKTSQRARVGPISTETGSSGEDDDVADLEGDAPRGAGAARGVAQGRRHFGGHADRRGRRPAARAGRLALPARGRGVKWGDLGPSWIADMAHLL